MNTIIENLIEIQEYEEALEIVTEYEEELSGDTDVYTYKLLCSLGIGDNEHALPYARRAIEEQPYVADAHYNCAYAYEINNCLEAAYEQYIITAELILAGNKCGVSLDNVLEKASMLLNEIVDSAEVGQIDAYAKHKLEYIANNNKNGFGIRNPLFHLKIDLIGTEYMDYCDIEKLYIGMTGLNGAFDFYCGRLMKDTVDSMAELQRTGEALHSKEVICEQESFVPVIADKILNINWSLNGGEREAVINYNSPYQYVNYRMPKGVNKISSGTAFRVGEVVPIGHGEDRKRLVLNIFVDGLSQTVLGENMKVLMPHTYKFFEKAIKCTNSYTAGDWTFPSIASIATGQTLPSHKMLHSKILRKIDEDTPILFEYFKNAGYNTTKIGGNWRIAPNYGYARGMNRVKYQHMYKGYCVEKVVADAEEQIYSMRETDQFIWMEIGELHTIADEINNAPLQSELMIWENEAYNGKVNSVKQDYDETKIKYYKKCIELIDRRLAGLYQYIEENYNDEDIIVSLFSDHGQGYLVRVDEEFLCDERSKIAFMFRGGNISGETDEVISACDYSAIMCKLAGIDYDYSKTDANLPLVFGGKKEREFCVTESIHVGDPYQILLNGKDFKFYLKGIENVNSECRVPLDEYETMLLDGDGNQICDEDRTKYYTDWCLKHISSCRIFNN